MYVLQNTIGLSFILRYLDLRVTTAYSSGSKRQTPGVPTRAGCGAESADIRATSSWLQPLELSQLSQSQLQSPASSSILLHLARDINLYTLSPLAAMAQYYPNQQQQQQQSYAPQANAQNLQFFPSSYSSVSGHTTPSQASYGAGFGGAPNTSAQTYPVGGGYGGFGSPAAGVSGRMGEQGGLRTGWLAAFGTEGYEGEPPLLEELGVNFEHIRTKVS